MPIVMTVTSLAMDPNTRAPFVVLQDAEKKRSLPIWIGMYEATAIATELEGVSLARPMTHDLLRGVLTSLGGELLRVEIVERVERLHVVAQLLDDAVHRSGIASEVGGFHPVAVERLAPGDRI